MNNTMTNSIYPKNISEIAYELYKLEWVNRHVLPKTQLSVYREYLLELNTAVPYNEEMDPFEVWLWDNNGYNGMLYACYEEFYDEEYQDIDYMKQLLVNEDLIKLYLTDLRRLNHEN